MTDHIKILLKVNLSQTQNKKNVNFNNILLNNKSFIETTKKLLEQFWKKAIDKNDYGNQWELFKYEIRKYAIHFSKEVAKIKRARIEFLIRSISNLTLNLGDNEQSSLLDCLQMELDDIYKEKAKGAFIRSRLKWFEEG